MSAALLLAALLLLVLVATLEPGTVRGQAARSRLRDEEPR